MCEQDFPPPINGWGKVPEPSDTSQAADILRLFNIRSGPYVDHRGNTQLPQVDFDRLWPEAEAIIGRLGVKDTDIDYYKSAPIPDT